MCIRKIKAHDKHLSDRKQVIKKTENGFPKSQSEKDIASWDLSRNGEADFQSALARNSLTSVGDHVMTSQDYTKIQLVKDLTFWF